MKKWIMWIYNINKDLDNLYKKIEERIHKLSLNYRVPALELYDRVLMLNDKKDSIINLRVLFNIMSDSLSKSENEFLLNVSKALRYQTSNEKEKRGKAGELNRIISICRASLVKAGFSTKRLEKEYSIFFAPSVKTAA